MPARALVFSDVDMISKVNIIKGQRFGVRGQRRASLEPLTPNLEPPIYFGGSRKKPDSIITLFPSLVVKKAINFFTFPAGTPFVKKYRL